MAEPWLTRALFGNCWSGTLERGEEGERDLLGIREGAVNSGREEVEASAGLRGAFACAWGGSVEGDALFTSNRRIFRCSLSFFSTAKNPNGSEASDKLSGVALGSGSRLWSNGASPRL